VESAVLSGPVAAGTAEACCLGTDQATHGSDINRRGNKSLFIFPPDQSEVTIVAEDAWMVANPEVGQEIANFRAGGNPTGTSKVTSDCPDLEEFSISGYSRLTVSLPGSLYICDAIRFSAYTRENLASRLPLRED
jgi:hypothetical protein